MSDKKIDERTPEEIKADLEQRQKDHVFMTTEEARAWNKEKGLRPLSEKHWQSKRVAERQQLVAMVESVHAQYDHRVLMAMLWKDLAVKYRDEIKVLQGQLAAINEECRTLGITSEEFLKRAAELERMMVYCDKCSAQPGVECHFRCPRDGTRA